MARRKNTQPLDNVPTYEEPAPPPEPVAPTGNAAPPHFRKGGGTAHKGDPRGKLDMYVPLYVPPGIAVAFYLAPGSPQGALSFQEAKMRGYVPATPELVTSDYDEAVKNQLICLPVYERSADGYVQVGPHVLMWRYTDEHEAEYNASLQRALSLNYASSVKVYEDEEEEIEAAIKYPEE